MNGRRDLPRPRQGARRLEQHQRHDLPARQPAGLRAVGRRPGHGRRGTTRTACRTSSAWRPAWRRRRRPVPRPRRARSMLERGPATNPLFGAFFEAVQQAGYDADRATSTATGRRASRRSTATSTAAAGCRAARAYLHPVMRPAEPRRAAPRAFVTRIVFEGDAGGRRRDRATGRGAAGHDRGAGEIILCGGAINSPQLLQLSGVGNARRARRARDRGRARPARRRRAPAGPPRGLHPARVHAAGVDGAVRCKWRPAVDRDAVAVPAARARARRTTSRRGGFARSNDDVAYPNLMFHFLPIAIRYDGSPPAQPSTATRCTSGRCTPTSRGSVKIRPTDPRVHPALRFNYLSTDQDRREWVEAVPRRAADPRRSRPSRRSTAARSRPARAWRPTRRSSTGCARDAETALHPSCTCRDGHRRRVGASTR